MLGHMNSTLVAKERRDASLNRGSDLLLDLWRHDTLADLGKKVVLRGELLAVRSLPVNNLLNRDLIKKTLDTSVDNRHLDLNSERVVLTLLQQLSQASTTVQGVTSRGIKVRTELSEGSQLTVLSKVSLSEPATAL